MKKTEDETQLSEETAQCAFHLQESPDCSKATVQATGVDYKALAQAVINGNYDTLDALLEGW